MIYTVTCNPSLDYTLQVPAFTADTINRSTRETLTYGGKGINVSAILTRLGIETCVWGFKAGLIGDKLEALLREEGILCDLITLSTGETRINVKIRSAAEWDVNACGPHVTTAEVEALLHKTDRLTAQDVLVLAGSVPAGLPDDLYEQLLQRLEGRNVLTAVDAEKALLRRVLRFRPFLIKPNHHELSELFQAPADTVEQIVPLARRLQGEGARNVLVSRAENGAVLVDENGCVHTVGSVNGVFRNSVGCGDSMVAGFLAGWLQTHDYRFALRLGTACGGATACSDFLATRAEIENALETVTLD